MPEGRTIKTTCPRDCYDGCGIVVIKDGEKISRVLGDPDHPASRGSLCSKCAVAYNGVWLDSSERLIYPKRRRGPKGGGHFERISWDEALAEVAEKLTSISAEWGAESILTTQEHVPGLPILFRRGSLPGWVRPKPARIRFATMRGTWPGTTYSDPVKEASIRGPRRTPGVSLSGARIPATARPMYTSIG